MSNHETSPDLSADLSKIPEPGYQSEAGMQDKLAKDYTQIAKELAEEFGPDSPLTALYEYQAKMRQNAADLERRIDERRQADADN